MEDDIDVDKSLLQWVQMYKYYFDINFQKCCTPACGRTHWLVGSNKPMEKKSGAVHALAVCAPQNQSWATRSHAVAARQAPCGRITVAVSPGAPRTPGHLLSLWGRGYTHQPKGDCVPWNTPGSTMY
ncbi:hypothetical protein Y1Q_0011285 [Alligator mississippiensis]|uniref:Uncharacterized protein n=1 Tax=Alligator mississippiensis TaxID=8496 RepID=A0A151N875_ALLMI|nr:hypothetical protein Y1Q_0011285 [Alligator mississippiensis]